MGMSLQFQAISDKNIRYVLAHPAAEWMSPEEEFKPSFIFDITNDDEDQDLEDLSLEERKILDQREERITQRYEEWHSKSFWQKFRSFFINDNTNAIWEEKPFFIPQKMFSEGEWFHRECGKDWYEMQELLGKIIGKPGLVQNFILKGGVQHPPESDQRCYFYSDEVLEINDHIKKVSLEDFGVALRSSGQENAIYITMNTVGESGEVDAFSYAEYNFGEMKTFLDHCEKYKLGMVLALF